MCSAAAICCSLVTLLPGHVLPDGFVERGIEVLVFPDQVEIRYRLGLSDGQMREELSLLGDRETANADPETAWSRFRELMGPEIVRGLRVRVNGEPRPLRLVTVEPWVSHHVSLQVVAVVDVDVGTESMTIDVRDEVPLSPEVRGMTRMALRGRRGVEIIESTGPVNLVRAERRPITAGGDDQVPTNCRIAASFCLPRAGDADDELTDVVTGRKATQPPTKSEEEPALIADDDESESDFSETDDFTVLSPRVSFWLVTGGLLLMAIGVALAIRQMRSRR